MVALLCFFWALRLTIVSLDYGLSQRGSCSPHSSPRFIPLIRDIHLIASFCSITLDTIFDMEPHLYGRAILEVKEKILKMLSSIATFLLTATRQCCLIFKLIFISLFPFQLMERADIFLTARLHQLPSCTALVTARCKYD